MHHLHRHRPFMSPSPSLLLPLLLLLLLPLSSCVAQQFSDVSLSVGLQRPYGPRIKYGGACLADLDGDGHIDLLFGHHDSRWAQIYFNDGSGNFTLSTSARIWIDGHGYTAFRAAPWQRSLHALLSRGGMQASMPNPPVVLSVRARTRVISELPDLEAIGLDPFVRGRGRSAIVVNLRNYKRRPDVIFMNAAYPAFTDFPQRVFSVGSGGSNGRLRFMYRNVSDNLQFTRHANGYGTVTDVDNDMHMEVLTWARLTMWKRPFHPNTNRPVNFVLQDVTATTIPNDFDLRGTIGVAELDFDNDGFFDLYVARTNTGEVKWLQRAGFREYADRLLHNTGDGAYEQAGTVDARSGELQTTGVTVGDFDNDGWVDILVSVYSGNTGYLYVNEKGRGTWTVKPMIERDTAVAGDQVTAVDYDGDGRLDVVVSEGEWFDKSRAGYYRIMRNVQDVESMGNYLLVRVGAAERRSVTSLHAVVKVCVKGSEVDRSDLEDVCMKRRVGSPGTVVSNSLIETVHFGVGNADVVLNCSVTWVDRSTSTQYDVDTNQLIVMGIL